MDVLVDVSNQHIRLSTHVNAFVAGTKNFIRFVFNLSDDWLDLSKYAQFTQGNISYNEPLFNNYYCWLPEKLKAGTCSMTLIGTNSTRVAITESLTFKIIDSIIHDGSIQPSDSPDTSTALLDDDEHYIITNNGDVVSVGSTSTRIINLPASQNFDSTDFIMVDSTLYGSRKFRFDLLTESDIERIWEGG